MQTKIGHTSQLLYVQEVLEMLFNFFYAFFIVKIAIRILHLKNDNPDILLYRIFKKFELRDTLWNLMIKVHLRTK